jgi:hypothetical protein
MVAKVAENLERLAYWGEGFENGVREVLGDEDPVLEPLGRLRNLIASELPMEMAAALVRADTAGVIVGDGERGALLLEMATLPPDDSDEFSRRVESVVGDVEPYNGFSELGDMLGD